MRESGLEKYGSGSIFDSSNYLSIVINGQQTFSDNLFKKNKEHTYLVISSVTEACVLKVFKVAALRSKISEPIIFVFKKK